MHKREAQFQTLFNTWLRNQHKQTGAYELKHTHGAPSLPFSSVQEHQVNALLACKHGTFAYKISDAGLNFKPMDCFSLSGVPSFVVIKYPDFFCLIDIDSFVKEKEISKRKSLTQKRAREISYLVI